MKVTKILVIYYFALSQKPFFSGCFNDRFASKQTKIFAQSAENQQVRNYSLINIIVLFSCHYYRNQFYLGKLLFLFCKNYIFYEIKYSLPENFIQCKPVYLNVYFISA
jgi:hypothetical protein